MLETRIKIKKMTLKSFVKGMLCTLTIVGLYWLKDVFLIWRDYYINISKEEYLECKKNSINLKVRLKKKKNGNFSKKIKIIPIELTKI